jgi:aspartyl-tRNA(Asn)/glutamyl-tRNA(Gln) amidotransferase subunit C
MDLKPADATVEKPSHTVNMEQVQRIAELAQLELTAEELPRMQRDLNAILGHVAQLNELDTADVPAMAQAAEITAGGRRDNRLRPDTLAPSLPRETVMAEAPETDGVYFKTPKVIER